MNSDHVKKAIEILERARVLITDDSDTLWTHYDNGREFRDDIDAWIGRLKLGDETVLEKLNLSFAPTSDFQEHSLSNDWAEEYLDLSAQWDQCLQKLRSG